MTISVYSDVALESRTSILLFVFCGQKDLALMLFTLRSIICMVTSLLWDQQYMFGVRSLLMVENVLMTNDVAMEPAISHQRRFFIRQACQQLG